MKMGEMILENWYQDEMENVDTNEMLRSNDLDESVVVEVDNMILGN